jgi:predicted nucleotide-binding protein (sugar kinase/HSP70/actin superfamily)
MIPFYLAFLHELGFDPLVSAGGDQAALKRGINEANNPFCAPMQLYHGMAGKMADENADFLFLPMVRGISRNNGERDSNTCPIIQGSADILRLNLRQRYRGRIITPVIDMGHGNLQSRDFLDSCCRLAGELGIQDKTWRTAYETAAAVQQQFEKRCLEIGSRALAFSAECGLAATIVLGRPYTIYNRILNSNVPSILREQGMLAIPLDCYPVSREVPTFDGMYWGYGQRILRAAHQIRKAAGIYGVYCSNYSCGPDSFNLHFFSYIMEGKPFAIIETDGHAGDAGTRTRIEAFLHCVAEDFRAQNRTGSISDCTALQVPHLGLKDVRSDECILIPSLGTGSEVVAAAMRGLGYRAEVLPAPDAKMKELGRRHTSGKECAPMCLTLGSLLGRLEAEKAMGTRFVFMMAGGRGPCRFGVYNMLNQLILDRLGMKDRVRVYAPQDSSYFSNTPQGFPVLVFSGLVAADLLLAALLDVRPREIDAGSADAIYRRSVGELLALIAREAEKRPSLACTIGQISSGRLFGIADVLREAADNFARVRGKAEPPTVAVVGEIYMRLNPFANDFIIEKLEQRGIRVRLAPLSEWLEYADYLGRLGYTRHGLPDRFRSVIQRRIMRLCSRIFAEGLGDHYHCAVTDSLEAAGEYLRKDLWGEAVLTLGYSISEWHNQHIDGVINLGPLECMPTKIAEAQFFHFAEQHKVPVLTLQLDGQSLDPQSLDNFVFEIQSRHRLRSPQFQKDDRFEDCANPQLIPGLCT